MEIVEFALIKVISAILSKIYVASLAGRVIRIFYTI